VSSFRRAPRLKLLTRNKSNKRLVPGGGFGLYQTSETRLKSLRFSAAMNLKRIMLTVFTGLFSRHRSGPSVQSGVPPQHMDSPVVSRLASDLGAIGGGGEQSL
jgi:hypothetical protein